MPSTFGFSVSWWRLYEMNAMTESSSGSFTAMSFGSMVDGMFIFSATFSPNSIRWSPAGLLFASFMSMKSGSSLLISSRSVLPSFLSELKFLILCSTTSELTHSSSAFFDASALFGEIRYFSINVHIRPRTSFGSPSRMFCASMLTSLTRPQ